MTSREFLEKVRWHPAFLPVTIFLGLVVILVVSTTLTDRPPKIEAISPQVGFPGGVMVIVGTSFGSSRGTAEVIIAGIRPTTSAYLEWTNRRISVRIPQDVDSGMVYVVRKVGQSNGRLFTNKNNIPVVVDQAAAPGQPHIASIDPHNGSVGTPITISGRNFGAAEGSGKVYFTPASLSEQTGAGIEIGQKERFAGCGCDYPIQSWSDTKIVAYVPDGASSGNVTVVTDRGASNSEYFELSSKVGTESFRDKRGYQIQYGVRIADVASDSGGTIDLWVPELSDDLSQRHVERITEPSSPANVAGGLMRFRLDNWKTQGSVSVTYYFDRYAVETQIDASKVPAAYDTKRRLYTVYTAPDALVPSDNPQIVAEAQQAVGTEQNPYRKARLIYDYLLSKLQYSAGVASTDIVANLDSGTGNSYTYAIAFSAMARAAGIPARPIAGYVVYGNKQASRHYWAEFYVQDFGWVPVDPALGDGATYGDFPSRSNVADYYFGNIDSRHIALTRGIVTVPQTDASAKLVTTSPLASLQTIFAAASPAVKSFTTNWLGMTVVDWW